MYLYRVAKLFNVRLDPERIRKAQFLRERGLSLSDVVREAIDERFSDIQSLSQPDVKGLVRRMFEEHRDPAALPARGYDVHDRHAARDAIVRQLRKAK